MSHKVCRMCRRPKQIHRFYRHTSMKDGHQIYCKPCWDAYLRGYRTGRSRWERELAEYGVVV